MGGRGDGGNNTEGWPLDNHPSLPTLSPRPDTHAVVVIDNVNPWRPKAS